MLIPSLAPGLNNCPGPHLNIIVMVTVIIFPENVRNNDKYFKFVNLYHVSLFLERAPLSLFCVIDDNNKAGHYMYILGCTFFTHFGYKLEG